MFNEKLIELRKQNNHTQESLAKQLYVSRSLIAKWEQGRSYPTLEDLEKILKLYDLEFDDLMTKEELKNIYGIISRKNKKKKKIIVSLSLFLSVFLITMLILPFCFVENVLQARQIQGEFNMRYGYSNIVLENRTTIEIDDETKLLINGEKVNFLPEKINYESFNKCLITYDVYKRINGYNMTIGDILEINTIELIEPICENTIGFYIDFEAVGLNGGANYNKDSVLYFYFDNTTNEVISNFTFNQKLIHKKNLEFGISYYEYLFEMNLDFEKIKEYYLRSNQDIGYARIPIYFILSNGEISSLPTHNYFKSRKARYIELSWGSGMSYGEPSLVPFNMFVCNMESKYINPSSDYLYQNVLFNFAINMDW